MACNLPSSWKPVIHSQISNTMDQQNMDIITSAFLGDNNIMLSAVASLLSRHQSSNINKDHDSLVSPKLDLINNTTSKDSVLANVILSTVQNKSNISEIGKSHSTENLISNFEQVHALATANLVASTQRDIAKQLAEASTLSHSDSGVKVLKYNDRKIHQEQKDTLTKRKSENQKKCEKNRISKSSLELPVSSVVDLKSSSCTLELKALICSFEGCNRKFAWQNHLKYHELTHTNNRQFKCSDESCGKTFFTAQRLNVHLRTHTGEKPFGCSHQDCTKTFTTAGNLKNHQRIHTGEQPYICDYINCNRRFTELSSLRKHKLTHSGDKPFECNICGKKFTQSGSRRQHLIRHHLDDEIRQSFNQERKEKDVDDEDEVMDEERKEMLGCGTSCSPIIQKETSTINAVSCSPQVLVLNNAYSGLSTSDSVVLSHSLSDHIVTVKTEVLDNPISDSHSITLSHTLLSSDGLHEGVLHGKVGDFVVLPEASIYEHDENTGDIVYASNILDHEEVTHTDYVSSHVDYSGVISHSNYSNHRELSSGDDFVCQEVCHSENFITSSCDVSVAEYVAAECKHVSSVNSYTDSKSHSYLDSEQEIAHTEFIGAEEIAVAQYTNDTATSSDLVCVENLVSQGNSQATAEHSHCSGKMFTLEEATLIGNSSSCHQDLTYFPSIPDSDQSLVVVEVSNHSSHAIATSQVDREMHMDPMMECDEEPEKH